MTIEIVPVGCARTQSRNAELDVWLRLHHSRFPFFPILSVHLRISTHDGSFYRVGKNMTQATRSGIRTAGATSLAQSARPKRKDVRDGVKNRKKALSHWVSASHNEEGAWPDVCCYGPIVSLQEQEFISPVNSHYVKEDAIHPGTPALGFHLDYQRAFTNRVLRPHQIKIYETRYEGMEGGGVKRESKWGQRSEEEWDFFSFCCWPYLPPAPSCGQPLKSKVICQLAAKEVRKCGELTTLGGMSECSGGSCILEQRVNV